jgi:carbamoyl-phosphate synthase small subunit
MTYPLIGNYGVNDQDIESSKIAVEGFVVRELSPVVSNWRAKQDLSSYLKAHGVVAVEGVDTRAITKHIRLQGAMKGVISTESLTNEELVEKVKASPGLIGRDLIKTVTTDKEYCWSHQGKYKVVVIDCGVKYNILRNLAANDCQVIVVPADTEASRIMQIKPDAVMVSNGPGDPAAVPYVVATVKELIGKLPLFGICFGHQILGLALGGKTYKLKFGHHGGNHPVKDLITNQISITAQNHGFCVDIDSLDDQVIKTHLNLNDKTLEGIRHKKLPIFSVQFHPESAPGPHDARYLFSQFINLIDKQKELIS